MNIDLSSQIHTELGGLPLDAQQSVLEYVRALKQSRKGTPGSLLMRHAGSITSDDARQMMDAIEAGCEQVDPNEW